MIVIDVETTGKQSHFAHIVEVAAVVLDEHFDEKSHFQQLANPGDDALALASEEAMRVNGLSIEEIKKSASSLAVAHALRGVLEAHPTSKIHAFNNSFDIWFLAREPWSVSSKRWGECIMLASMEPMEAEGALERFPNGKAKWPRLEEAARFFGVPYGKGHRALDDARAAARVYAEILRRREETGEIEDEVRAVLEDGF